MAKYREDLVDAICKMVENGVSVSNACASVGISRATYHRWKETNETFLVRIEEAKGKLIRVMEEGMLRDTAEDWRARAWWLERRLPHIYGKREHRTIEKTTSGEVRVIFELPPEGIPKPTEDEEKPEAEDRPEVDLPKEGS
jgi:hypothetical protein